MSGIQVVIDDKGARRILKAAAASVGSKRLLDAIGERHLKAVNDNFRKGGVEKKWAPLTENTKAARKRGGDKPLQDTGRLRQSFDYKTSLSGHRVIVGTRSRIASYHQDGTKPYLIPKGKPKLLAFVTVGGLTFATRVKHPGLPARPMLPSTKLAKKLAIAVAEAVIKRDIKKAGG